MFPLTHLAIPRLPIRTPPSHGPQACTLSLLAHPAPQSNSRRLAGCARLAQPSTGLAPLASQSPSSSQSHGCRASTMGCSSSPPWLPTLLVHCLSVRAPRIAEAAASPSSTSTRHCATASRPHVHLPTAMLRCWCSGRSLEGIEAVTARVSSQPSLAGPKNGP